MATLFDSASLVMIPSGYKDDKLYSIKPTNGDGDFTFSRDGAGASPATRVNASGLIEKGRENLLTYSNTFINAVWIKSGASVTSGQSGYDGSSDAWALTTTATAGSHRVYHSSVNSSGIVTCSVYAKANGYSHLFIYANTPSGTDRGAYFDLLGGSVGTQTNKIVDATITSVGGGWYRCDVKQDNSLGIFELYVGDGENISFTGDGTSGILIQDAQVENGLVSTSYIETTTAPVSAGLLGDMPRLDYSGRASCPSLLLEPSRVNYLPHSEYISGGWLNAGGTSSQNSQDSTSPEGVYNAAVLNASSAVYRIINASSNPHTFSVYAKQKDGNNIQLRIDAPTTKTSSFNLANGSVVSEGSGHTASIEDAGNGWYRCIISFTDSIVNAVLQTDASGSVYVYGAQLEDNLYPTSYIPTYGSASTRGADYTFTEDSILNVGTNDFTAFIDIDELNFSAPVSGESFTAIFGNRENGSTRWWRVWSRSTISALYLELQSDGGYRNYTIDNVPTSDTRKKICVVRTGTTIKAFINGVQKLNQSSAISGVLSTTNDKIELSSWNSGASANCFMPTNQVLYFNTALTDAECISLTTL